MLKNNLFQGSTGSNFDEVMTGMKQFGEIARKALLGRFKTVGNTVLTTVHLKKAGASSGSLASASSESPKPKEGNEGNETENIAFETKDGRAEIQDPKSDSADSGAPSSAGGGKDQGNESPSARLDDDDSDNDDEADQDAGDDAGK